MRKSRSANGEGYTVRIGSKKVLKTSLLEQQVEQAKRQYEELLQQNELLRAKEALDVELLESCEVGLQHMGAAAARLNPGSTSAHSTSLLEAALLDMQALELKQVLTPPAPMQAGTPSGQQPAAAAAGDIKQELLSPLSSTPGQKSMAVSSSSHSSGDGSIGSGMGTPSEDSCESANRTKRLLGSLTAADVLGFQGLSLEEVGGRFRACIGRLALARQANQQAAPSLDVTSTVEDFGKICLLSLISNEDRHCQVIGLNLESMKHEAPPPGLWAQVAAKANLQPLQKEHIKKAYRVCSQQQGQLMQQQRKVVQQLQTILTSGSITAPAAGAGAGPAAASSDASAATRALLAPGPVSAQDLQLLASMCRQQAADGTSSSWFAGAGLLPLEDAERVEQLLGTLSRLSRALKQQARRLSTMLINQLDSEQHADAILLAYPFILNCPALCACVAEAEQ